MLIELNEDNIDRILWLKDIFEVTKPFHQIRTLDEFVFQDFKKNNKLIIPVTNESTRV